VKTFQLQSMNSHRKQRYLSMHPNYTSSNDGMFSDLYSSVLYVTAFKIHYSALFVSVISDKWFFGVISLSLLTKFECQTHGDLFLEKVSWKLLIINHKRKSMCFACLATISEFKTCDLKYSCHSLQCCAEKSDFLK
jgi:hypothetical protein